MIDVLIRDALVVDGTGAPPFRGDVAVEGGRIAAVGELDGAQAERTIDAAGRMVCPGFVDPHSHSDFTLLTVPTADSTVRQGVTTEVVGNCGWTYAPVTPASERFIEARLRTFAYEGQIEWRTFGEHLSHLQHVGHSVNLAWFVGHNTVRYAAGVFGPQATEEQLRLMEGFVAEAMDAGALGLSTGLEFNPGRQAPTEEIVRLNKVVGRYENGSYTSHVRNRDQWLQDSIDEFLLIIREGGTKGEISHLNVRHRTNAEPGAWQRAVDAMVAARDSGLDVLADTTPFRDGLGQMAGILPQWVLADGWEEACKRLDDRAVRERLRGECDRYWRFIHKGDWHRVRLQASPQHPGLEGKDFHEIATLLGTDEWNAYFQILAEAGPALESLLLIGELFTDEHLAEMISHPLFNLGVDGYTAALDAGLDGIAGHPVCFAGHVHYLTHHVGELKTLPLEEAVHKMTSMPAQHFGFSDRGELRPGLVADLAVIDLERLDDGSTLEHPLAYVEGVDEVLVNGVAVIAAGEHTGRAAGAAPGTPLIDLRSDFCAPPTEEMWAAMREAEIGWATPGQDTVRELETQAAELLGKEDALFAATCTQANLLALLALSSPGERVALEPDAHVLVNEGDWLTELTRLVPVGPDEEAPLAILENTHTRSGGTIRTGPRPRAERVHLDGARLPNAAVALGVPLAEPAAAADTVALSLNKGLCAPYGAVLAGPRAATDEARAHQRRLGGASVHKAAILAAAGLVALTLIDRLADDHRRARRLAELLGLPAPETNILHTGLGVEALPRLAEAGVLAFSPDGLHVRFVTHRGISDRQIEEAAAVIESSSSRAR